MHVSIIGLIYILMLTIPNIIWTKHQPKGYETRAENTMLVLLERVGQVAVTTLAVLFNKAHILPATPWSLVLVVSFIVMIMYELWWVRYFRSNKQLEDFYSSFLGVPVAGATLPIIGFLLLGIYSQNILLIIAVIILGIGHIGIHLEHRKMLEVR